MRRISSKSVSVTIITVLIYIAPLSVYAQVLLKEALVEGQEIRQAGGKVAVVSKKTHAIVVAPDSIMVPHGQNIKLKIGFFNRGKSPLEVSEDSVRVHSKGKKLKLISEKKLIKAIKKEYSASKMGLEKESEKTLAPYVKDKIDMLRKELLHKTTIPSDKNYWGTVIVKTPDNKNEMTIEATIGGETHNITYNVISLK